MTVANDGMPGVLTIEDDAAIRRGIVAALQATGHTVWQAERADDGAAMALQNRATGLVGLGVARRQRTGRAASDST